MRGQAASEYLITYGWALLVLFIVISFVLATGMLSPASLISEECNIGPTLPCIFQLYQDGSDLKLATNISNGFSYKIGIKDIKFTLEEDGREFIVQTSVLPVIESGGSARIDATLPNSSASKNSIKKIKVEVTYYSCALEVNPSCDPAAANHILSGRIIGRVGGD